MIVLGLTGSIGMGKSTTAQFFRDAGIPVHDADAVVHHLYETDAVAPVGALFPDVVDDGKIDRRRLGTYVLDTKNAENMKKLEAIIHPMVRDAEIVFRKKSEDAGAKLAILDIPLLFETGRDQAMDGVIVVTAPEDVQKKRVLARPDMSETKFQSILARQTPDLEKRERADFVIDTSKGLESAKQAVAQIIEKIVSGAWLPSK